MNSHGVTLFWTVFTDLWVVIIFNPDRGREQIYVDTDNPVIYYLKRNFATKNHLYTSLKPWNRNESDMWNFARFLEFWGWRL